MAQIKILCLAKAQGFASKSVTTASLCKGKDPRDAAGSHWGIRLLSIAGTVYAAAVFLHCSAEQVEPELHEARNGFRKRRGATVVGMREREGWQAKPRGCWGA
eukprot:352392-Chlamydomonas_euryale.AAC.2